MSVETQGIMTNARLLAVVREAARDLVDEDLLEGSLTSADKPTLLRALATQRGLAAVVSAGFALWNEAYHPVLDALQRGGSAREVMERWGLLERFGHTRHRTRVVAEDAEKTSPSLSLEHVALDGGTIDPLNDLFIWGLLARLLEQAGFEDVVARLGDSTDAPAIYQQGGAAPLNELPASSSRVVLSWRPGRSIPTRLLAPPVEPDTSSDARSLQLLFASDILRTWRLDDAARFLRRSTRQLQRNLRQENTSFSELVHRTRLDAARQLMKDQRLSLTEIAFCAGFADLAHFSRVFCRYLDVPPSAFRELVMKERGDIT